MSLELTGAAAFAVAVLATFLATPVAIAVAVRTSFFDLPAGYKGHKRPTPYLGGTAIMVGILAAVLSVGGVLDRYGVLVGCAVAIWVVGTIDDRVNLPILLRMVAEVGVAVLLWATGHGWTLFHNGAADLLLTVVWVVGVMNAFNLMDNMDGAAASTAAISALGAGMVALIAGHTLLAPLCFAVAGSCAGFLPRNLSSPPRIFMGDGGSLQVGLLISGVTMGAVSRDYFGPSGVVIAALLVALVILDTTLVTVSRSRAGRSVLTGGRDHLTHRLAHRLGPPRNVVLTLAVTQLAVCGATIAVARAGVGWVLLAGGVGAVLGALLIWQFECSPRFRQPAVSVDPGIPLSVALGPVPLVSQFEPVAQVAAAGSADLAS
ncbi:MAG TPA: MraY family glycosyltransferase [Solirubrobacteraceae bacterium]|jgi:UDP-GlcNAc:undecaprenyl-phosphate GlcNAc-1-phosphate transferase|nr:MraY family glycosyltransferase [Solirubrobacteraceae bacterium]